MGSYLTRLLDKVLDLGAALKNFCVETVQWQKPLASSVYLMIVNTIFWYVSFAFSHGTRGVRNTSPLACIKSLVLLLVGSACFMVIKMCCKRRVGYGLQWWLISQLKWCIISYSLSIPVKYSMI